MPKPKYLRLDQIPDDDRRVPGDEQHPFHKALQSEEWFNTQFLILMNEIRGAEPSKQSDEECRARLSKIKMLQELIDLPDTITNIPKEIPEEELPEDDADPFAPDAYLKNKK